MEKEQGWGIPDETRDATDIDEPYEPDWAEDEDIDDIDEPYEDDIDEPYEDELDDFGSTI